MRNPIIAGEHVYLPAVDVADADTLSQITATETSTFTYRGGKPFSPLAFAHEPPSAITLAVNLIEGPAPHDHRARLVERIARHFVERSNALPIQAKTSETSSCVSAMKLSSGTERPNITDCETLTLRRILKQDSLGF